MIYVIYCQVGDCMLPTTSQQGFPAYQDDFMVKLESKKWKAGLLWGIIWVDGWCFMISICSFFLAFLNGGFSRYRGVPWYSWFQSHPEITMHFSYEDLETSLNINMVGKLEATNSSKTWEIHQRFTQQKSNTPPKFNSSPLKNDAWKNTFFLGALCHFSGVSTRC